MKRNKGLRRDQIAAPQTSGGYAEEEQFRFAGTEEVAETCCSDADFWAESELPADAERPDFPIAS